MFHAIESDLSPLNLSKSLVEKLLPVFIKSLRSTSQQDINTLRKHTYYRSAPDRKLKLSRFTLGISTSCGDMVLSTGMDNATKQSTDGHVQSSKEISSKILESLSNQQKFSVLLGIFPGIKPSKLKRMLNKCKGNVARTIDRILDKIIQENSGQRVQRDKKTSSPSSSRLPYYTPPHLLAHVPLHLRNHPRYSYFGTIRREPRQQHYPTKKFIIHPKYKPYSRIWQPPVPYRGVHHFDNQRNTMKGPLPNRHQGPRVQTYNDRFKMRVGPKRKPAVDRKVTAGSKVK